MNRAFLDGKQWLINKYGLGDLSFTSNDFQSNWNSHRYRDRWTLFTYKFVNDLENGLTIDEAKKKLKEKINTEFESHKNRYLEDFELRLYLLNSTLITNDTDLIIWFFLNDDSRMLRLRALDFLAQRGTDDEIMRIIDYLTMKLILRLFTRLKRAKRFLLIDVLLEQKLPCLVRSRFLYFGSRNVIDRVMEDDSGLLSVSASVWDKLAWRRPHVITSLMRRDRFTLQSVLSPGEVVLNHLVKHPSNAFEHMITEMEQRSIDIRFTIWNSSCHNRRIRSNTNRGRIQVKDYCVMSNNLQGKISHSRYAELLDTLDTSDLFSWIDKRISSKRVRIADKIRILEYIKTRYDAIPPPAYQDHFRILFGYNLKKFLSERNPSFEGKSVTCEDILEKIRHILLPFKEFSTNKFTILKQLSILLAELASRLITDQADYILSSLRTYITDCLNSIKVTEIKSNTNLLHLKDLEEEEESQCDTKTAIPLFTELTKLKFKDRLYGNLIQPFLVTVKKTAISDHAWLDILNDLAAFKPIRASAIIDTLLLKKPDVVIDFFEQNPNFLIPDDRIDLSSVYSLENTKRYFNLHRNWWNNIQDKRLMRASLLEKVVIRLNNDVESYHLCRSIEQEWNEIISVNRGVVDSARKEREWRHCAYTDEDWTHYRKAWEMTANKDRKCYPNFSLRKIDTESIQHLIEVFEEMGLPANCMLISKLYGKKKVGTSLNRREFSKYIIELSRNIRWIVIPIVRRLLSTYYPDALLLFLRNSHHVRRLDDVLSYCELRRHNNRQKDKFYCSAQHCNEESHLCQVRRALSEWRKVLCYPHTRYWTATMQREFAAELIQWTFSSCKKIFLVDTESTVLDDLMRLLTEKLPAVSYGYMNRFRHVFTHHSKPNASVPLSSQERTKYLIGRSDAFSTAYNTFIDALADKNLASQAVSALRYQFGISPLPFAGRVMTGVAESSLSAVKMLMIIQSEIDPRKTDLDHYSQLVSNNQGGHRDIQRAIIGITRPYIYTQDLWLRVYLPLYRYAASFEVVLEMLETTKKQIHSSIRFDEPYVLWIQAMFDESPPVRSFALIKPITSNCWQEVINKPIDINNHRLLPQVRDGSCITYHDAFINRILNAIDPIEQGHYIDAYYTLLNRPPDILTELMTSIVARINDPKETVIANSYQGIKSWHPTRHFEHVGVLNIFLESLNRSSSQIPLAKLICIDDWNRLLMNYALTTAVRYPGLYLNDSIPWNSEQLDSLRIYLNKNICPSIALQTKYSQLYDIYESQAPPLPLHLVNPNVDDYYNKIYGEGYVQRVNRYLTSLSNPTSSSSYTDSDSNSESYHDSSLTEKNTAKLSKLFNQLNIYSRNMEDNNLCLNICKNTCLRLWLETPPRSRMWPHPIYAYMSQYSNSRAN